MALDALALEIQIRSASANQQALKAVSDAIKSMAEQTKSSFDAMSSSAKETSTVLQDHFAKQALGEAQKSAALTNISMRDMGATFVIQAQKIKVALAELQEGFFAFEIASQQVKVVGDLTAEQQIQIEDAAVRIAKAYNLQATEVVGAFREMIARGVEFEDAQRIVEDAAKGGAAGLATIEEASLAAITTIRQFGLNMDESNNIMAKMVFIANESGATVADLGASLSIAGSQAAQMGFSFEETAAAIAFLRDAGLDASSAGTALRQFLIRIQDPTGESAALLEDLGIEIEDSAGNFKSLTDIMREVEAATEDMTAVERAHVTAQLFEVRGQQLLNITRSRSIDDLEAMIEATGKFSDEQTANIFLNDKASEATDTWAARMNEATQRLDDAKRGIAEGFVPAQIMMTNASANFLESINQWPEVIRAPVQGLIVFGGEALNVVGQMALLGANLKTLFPQMKIFTAQAKNMRLAALGAGFAIAGIATAMMAMQEQDAATRNMLIALTALEFGLAAASLAGAIGKTFFAHAGIPIVGPIIAGALVAGMVATFLALTTQAKAVGAARGTLVSAAPGVGGLFNVGEGITPEIISPVPTMRETVREVIREESGGKTQVNINPTYSGVMFSSPEMMDELSRKLSDETVKALRRRGAISR